MNDRNIWDDSMLIDSWDGALNEYKARLYLVHSNLASTNT